MVLILIQWSLSCLIVEHLNYLYTLKVHYLLFVIVPITPYRTFISSCVDRWLVISLSDSPTIRYTVVNQNTQLSVGMSSIIMGYQSKMMWDIAAAPYSCDASVCARNNCCLLIWVSIWVTRITWAAAISVGNNMVPCTIIQKFTSL